MQCDVILHFPLIPQSGGTFAAFHPRHAPLGASPSSQAKVSHSYELNSKRDHNKAWSRSEGVAPLKRWNAMRSVRRCCKRRHAAGRELAFQSRGGGEFPDRLILQGSSSPLRNSRVHLRYTAEEAFSFQFQLERASVQASGMWGMSVINPSPSVHPAWIVRCAWTEEGFEMFVVVVILVVHSGRHFRGAMVNK